MFNDVNSVWRPSADRVSPVGSGNGVFSRRQGQKRGGVCRPRRPRGTRPIRDSLLLVRRLQQLRAHVNALLCYPEHLPWGLQRQRRRRVVSTNGLADRQSTNNVATIVSIDGCPPAARFHVGAHRRAHAVSVLGTVLRCEQLRRHAQGGDGAAAGVHPEARPGRELHWSTSVPREDPERWPDAARDVPC